MNTISQQIYEILRNELSEITSKTILQEKLKKIGKDPSTLQKEDINDLLPLLLSSVLLFGGEEKASVIKKKLMKLIDSV